MTLFTATFVPAMLLMPIVTAACVRTRSEFGGDALLARTRMLRLVVATIAAFAIFGTVAAYVGAMAVHTWPLFFILFFGFAMPVMAAKNPSLVDVHAGHGKRVRAATLVSRTHTSPLRSWHWAIVWTIAGASLLLTISGLTRFAAAGAPIGAVDGVEATLSWSHLGVSLGMLLVWLPILAFLPWGIKLVLREPEPMDLAGSPELARGYERHRNFKVWGFYWLFGIAMNLHLGATSVAAAWYGPEQSLGIFGAAGGVLGGVAGAVFGTTAGIQRLRLTRMLRELNARETAGAV